ncbi:uncharacterized protein LOC110262884 [Arachis ipaensis]|uniref:uncharacterized protein LOC110262884 n=1 Tax=Arachis ipaensis TaxID=130454 RepID=UPI000A2AFE8E|nr:uncharacterized protein LOC110262884 [Arachis ipaensis]
MVYFVNDEVNKDWSVVMHLKPRDSYDMGGNEDDEACENEPCKRGTRIYLKQQQLQILHKTSQLQLQIPPEKSRQLQMHHKSSPQQLQIPPERHRQLQIPPETSRQQLQIPPEISQQLQIPPGISQQLQVPHKTSRQ